MAKYVRQSKEEMKKARLRRVLIAVLIAAVALAGGVLFFRRQVKEQFASEDTKEVQTASVTVGSIKTTVSGSGNLTSEGVLDVELPALVTLEETLAEAGDAVEAGQLLAAIDPATALSALKQLQEELEDLDDDLEDASGDKVGSSVYAGVSGRVKAVYTEPGDAVSTVMAEHGALMLLSLDGHLAVDIPAGSLNAGEEVTVTTSDGEAYDGTVDKVEDDTATILITDDGPLCGDTAAVGGETGELYIHEPLKITGYAGSVKTVHGKENAKVTSATRLLTLEDTKYSANYEKLLADRAELEQMYQTLVRLYRDGGIRAAASGTIQSLEEFELTGNEGVLDTVVLMKLDPDETVSVTIGVDETDIQSLDVGQEASVTIDSIGEDVFTGTVTEINKTAASSSGGVTQYTATVTLDKTEAMLSGMTADVAVTIEGVDNALLVPEDAVHKTSATSYVYTSYNEETGELGGMVEVATGLSNGSYTEITSGLNEGDTVYYTEKENQFSFGGFNFGGGMPSGGGMQGGGMSGGMPGGMGGSGGMGNGMNRTGASRRQGG